jgi:hypothetical protein
MSQKLLKCALAGGVVLFIWSAIFWMVFACKMGAMRGFQDEGDVASAIVDNAPRSGLYMLPYAGPKAGKEKMKHMEEKMAKGPVVFASVNLEGKNPHMGLPMLGSLILKIFVAYVISWMVLSLKLVEPRKVVKFTGFIGLVIGCMVGFPPVIWFGYPGSHVVTALLDSVIGWVLAGFAIAKVAK